MTFPDVEGLAALAEKASISELSELVGWYRSTDTADIVWPEEQETLGFASVSYLDRFKQRLVAAGRFTADELDLIMRHARGYAGGVARAERQRQQAEPEEDSLAANEAYYQVAAFTDVRPVSLVEDKLTPWLQITPAAGKTFSHPRFGKLVFTREKAQRIVSNFQNRVYQEHIPIDAEHQTKLSGAFGYYRNLRVRTDGAVEAQIELNDRGRQAFKSGGYRYFSPEFFRQWKDPSTDREYEDVLVGGALTTRPFFKDQHLAPLVSTSEYEVWRASERSTKVSRWKTNEDGTLALDENGEPQLTDEARAEQEVEATKAAEAAVSRFREEHKLTDDKLAELGDDDDDKDKDDKVAATESFAEAYPEQAKELEQYRERTQQLERAAQTQRFTDLVRGRDGEGDGRPWLGETEKHVSHLMKMSEAFGEDSEEVRWYVEQQREHAEQVARGQLFSERGTSQRGQPDTGDTETKAKKLAEEKQISLGEAMEQVLAESPDAYAEYLEESEATPR